MPTSQTPELLGQALSSLASDREFRMSETDRLTSHDDKTLVATREVLSFA
jgi:hypothetical protein